MKKPIERRQVNSAGEKKNDNSEPMNLAEIEAFVQHRLSKQVWDYYASGADEQCTVKRKSKAYDACGHPNPCRDQSFRPRVLRDVSAIDTSTSLFGQRYIFPIAIPPSAMQKLVGGEGELDMARAAAKAGLIYILSSNLTSLLENVIQAPSQTGTDSNPQFWFQIYVSQNRQKSAELIRRAEKAGYKALVLTVDTPVLGNRLNERKTPLTLPEHLSLVNLNDSANAGSKVSGPTKNRLMMNAHSADEASEIAHTAEGSLNDAKLTWKEAIPWLRKTTSVKLILKGIMTAEDASLAVEAGVDAIIVSNHSGRQLDGVPATIEVLPEIVDAVADRIPVIFDGGVRRGSDVFKTLALGANLVLIGRSALWGLGFKGQEGVELVFNILEREL